MKPLLSWVGLATVSEVDTLRAERDELNLKLTDAMRSVVRLAIETSAMVVAANNERDGAIRHGEHLQRKLSAACLQHEQLGATFDAQTLELSALRDERDRLAQELNAANELIAQQQRRLYPQLRFAGGLAAGATPDANRKVDGEPQPDEQKGDSESEDLYRFIGVEGRHHWTLAREGARITVPLLDREFLEEVRTRKRTFGAGDIVRVLLRTVTFQRANGELYVRQSITKVLEVTPRPEQQPLLNHEEVPDGEAVPSRS